MKRASAIFASLLFLVIAPGVVAGVIPWAITNWRPAPPLLGVGLLPWVGGALVVAGISVLLNAFARFAIEGLGTPAPIYPTEYLVASGPYRFARNPMYLALVVVIFGQALLLGSLWLIVYGAVVWLASHIFVLVYEEPTLRRRYGTQFDAYCRHVPRWLPRVTPFEGANV